MVRRVGFESLSALSVRALALVSVAGPQGSGTSAVARRAARELVDRSRGRDTGPGPRLLDAPAAGARGTHGVATSLLRRLDGGFDGRGFPTAEVLAGLLRRVRREGRPVVVVLDDVRVAGPDLAPIVRAVRSPDRFLPEGESGLPPLAAIVAGTPEGLSSLDRRVALGPPVGLAPYDRAALVALVRDRAERALGRPVPEPWVERIADRAVEDGGGARRAIDLLRRRLLGPLGGPRTSFPSRPPGKTLTVEPSVVRAIRTAWGNGDARLAEVRRLEAELARSQGARPLATTTLWRRIVRLEQAGYLRREIRQGGDGGSRSTLRVLTPITEWVTMPYRPGTPRAFERWVAGGDWRAADPRDPLRPAPPPGPSDDVAD